MVMIEGKFNLVILGFTQRSGVAWCFVAREADCQWPPKLAGDLFLLFGCLFVC